MEKEKTKCLSDKDYELLTYLFGMTENQLYNALKAHLIRTYSKEKVFVNENFLVAVGEVPIALVTERRM